MYGNTNNEEFSNFEGYEDHSVNLLYTWDRKNNLTGVVINLACPSQSTENEYLISADFWHDTRLLVHQRLGTDAANYGHGQYPDRKTKNGSQEANCSAHR